MHVCRIPLSWSLRCRWLRTWIVPQWSWILARSSGGMSMVKVASLCWRCWPAKRSRHRARAQSSRGHGVLDAACSVLTRPEADEICSCDCSRLFFVMARVPWQKKNTCNQKNNWRPCWQYERRFYTCIHTNTHTYIHTYIHTDLHTYIHTYIHFPSPWLQVRLEATWLGTFFGATTTSCLWACGARMWKRPLVGAWDSFRGCIKPS